MTSALHDLGDYISTALPQEVIACTVQLGELEVVVRRDAIAKVLAFLRDDANCQFRTLLDLCGVDRPEDDERFAVYYHLLSLTHNARVRVKLTVDEGASVPSVVSEFSAAGWWERETWDLFGIPFAGNPDLRRILTDYGFEGHPLRKDFPLSGHVELRYDDEQKRVVYEPVSLPQDFRSFDFLSPWEGMTGPLPGDEKATAEDAPSKEGDA